MKRTMHPHALELISGNWFWINDGGQDQQGEYRACVEAQGYRFDRVGPDNVDVMTPAQQILWQRDPACPRGGVVLSPHIRQWLEANVGAIGPDWYARAEPFDLFFVSIVFRRRTDALRLVRHVASRLAVRRD